MRREEGDIGLESLHQQGVRRTESLHLFVGSERVRIGRWKERPRWSPCSCHLAELIDNFLQDLKSDWGGYGKSSRDDSLGIRKHNKLANVANFLSQ